MSKLYLRGVNKPITISTSQARILTKWNDDETVGQKTKSKIGGVSFVKEDIKYIIENDAEDSHEEVLDTKRNENQEFYEEENRKYNQHISNLCDRKLEDKINDTKIYELAWASSTTNPTTEEFRNEIKKRQRAYFELHPKHPYAALNIFDLLPQEKKDEDSVREIIFSLAVRKINAIISESFRTAKFMHKM